MSVVPHSRHIQTGFEYIEETIKDGHFSLIDNTLVISYVEAGGTFSTDYIQNELMRLPGRFFPGFAITLPGKVLEKLNAIPPCHHQILHYALDALEWSWEEGNFSDKLRVKFMVNHSDQYIGDNPYGSPRDSPRSTWRGVKKSWKKKPLPNASPSPTAWPPPLSPSPLLEAAVIAGTRSSAPIAAHQKRSR
jgi:hypothetical protein